MKSYRFFGDEMEVLGQRLDAARQALSNSTNSWNKNYWQQTVDRLLFQWRQLPILHDGEAQMTIVPRWNVEYNFYERDYGNEGHGMTEQVFEKLFRHNVDLEYTWHKHREKRLARAQ